MRTMPIQILCGGLTAVLLLSACGSGGRTASFGERDSTTVADGHPATSSEQPPSSLAGCFAGTSAAACGLDDVAPDAFLNAVQACSFDETGFNCLFNAAFDHLGGAEIAQLLNLVADACIGDPTGLCTTVNDSLPDVIPVLSLPLNRGELRRSEGTSAAPSRKTVDGRFEDWKGQTSGIAGNHHYDRGEHIYTDYLYDAWGADDGDDWRRLQLLGPIIEIQARARRLDQLSQALGDQLDVPRPVGADDSYGDQDQPSGVDIQELRWAAEGDRLFFLARLSKLLEASEVDLLILVDNTDAGDDTLLSIGETGLSTARFDLAIRINASGVSARRLSDGSELGLDANFAVRPDGFDNAVEASFAADPLINSAGELDLVVLSLAPENQPANLAYREGEPVAGIYNEQRQALALYEGNVDAFGAAIVVEDLRRGRSEVTEPGPGYHERHFASGDNIAIERGELARAQRYGLFVPSAYAGEPVPISYWLHYRGGKAHSGAAWTPRLINELGEKPGHIVATPHGRGTSTWYTTDAHQDVFEVMADVESLLAVDTNRRYLSGYSMGGYGTYLFGLLYPDLFAAGYSTSGATTQGAWTGVGPDQAECEADESDIPEVGSGNICFIQANEGDANAQLNYRILENARHFPLAIHHGTDDELVPTTGVQRYGLRLFELGYRFDLLNFLGYEHFSQAIVDEWSEGARYMHSFVRPENPRQVTYKVVPALVDAVNTVKPDPDTASFDFRPDGAWWVDDLVVAAFDPANPRNTSVFGQIDATSFALPGDEIQAIPRGGLLNFGQQGPSPNLVVQLTPTGHSTPFVRFGQDWLALAASELENRFEASLTGLSAASLDIEGMGLDLSQVVTGSLSTDTSTIIRLANVGSAVDVSLDGQSLAKAQRGLVEFSLDPGSHQLELSPASSR